MHRRSAAAVFVFVTVVLDMLALGLIIPVLPKLVQSFLGNDVVRAAEIYGLFGSTWAAMQFVAAPVLGALSDRFGRRPVILLSNLGMALDYVAMALAPGLAWLFVGRLISGVTAASVPTAYAYIADTTEPDKRAGAFGMLGAAFGVGFILGPALGGLLGGLDPRMPFWAAAGMSFLNFLYGSFVLPESLPKDKRAAFAWKRANPVGSLSLLRSHSHLLGLAGVQFLSQLAHVVFPSVFVLYAGYRYGWDEKAVGLSLAVVGVSSMIVQAALVQPVVKWLGERKALLFGLACGALGFVWCAAAPTGLLFYGAMPLTALWGIAGAAVQGLMSRAVGPDEQGRLQGANGSMMGIAELVGPAIFTTSFAYFIAPEQAVKVPGAPFFIAAGLVLAATLLALKVAKPSTTPAVAEAA